jgi:galactokinase
VNLIGEHTDYNEGFTLPMAMPFDTVVAMSSVGDAASGVVTASSAGFGDLTFRPSADPAKVPTWARHLAGCVALLRERGIPAGGWRSSIDTDIPTGASLSSSAALEVAVITSLLARAGEAWSPIEVARLGQRVENEVVGLRSGIMDQFISAGAVAGHASLMDCRQLTLDPVPLPPGVAVAVMDTGTRRALADAAYDDRREACERAAAALDVSALRDADLSDVESIPDAIDRRRARHVVSENRRTLKAADAMRRGDIVELGLLMEASHVSLRDDYEVSGPGLDRIVEVAGLSPGCLAARMTGGGFAGGAVAIVRVDEADAFARAVVDGYRYEQCTAKVWMCDPAAGASVIRVRPRMCGRRRACA